MGWRGGGRGGYPSLHFWIIGQKLSLHHHEMSIRAAGCSDSGAARGGRLFLVDVASVLRGFVFCLADVPGAPCRIGASLMDGSALCWHVGHVAEMCERPSLNQ